MKKYTILFLLTISILKALAQQATVIDPTSLTVPRYADLAAIQAGVSTPQNGSLAFNNQTSTFWYYTFPLWFELKPSLWGQNGSSIFYTSGNVGIGNLLPNAPLEFGPTALKRTIVFSGANNDHQFNGFGVNLTGFGTEMSYQARDAAFTAHTFYAGINATTSKQLFQIKGNGQVSMGDGPNARLHFANQDYNRKIVLYEGTPNSDHNFYGFGVNNGVLRYQVNVASNDHAFYVGSSVSSSIELFRIKGTGNVGVGQSTPLSKFEVNGALATTIIKVSANITLDNTASVYYFLDKVEATLPDPATCANRRYVLSNRDDNNIQILGYVIEALDGTSITEILSATAIEIISDGTNWLQIK